MKHSEFSIGIEFWCGSKRWRCTDVGSRVVIAISLEPRTIMSGGQLVLSEEPRDLNGPPYGVVETVFDEYDIDACAMSPDD